MQSASATMNTEATKTCCFVAFRKKAKEKARLQVILEKTDE